MLNSNTLLSGSRTKLIAVVAAAILATTAAAFANGRTGGHGKPSVVPPPWSHGHPNGH